MMQKSRQSVVATIVRGFVLLLPVFVVGLALAKLVEMVGQGLEPLLAAVPQVFFHNPVARVAFFTGLLLLLFFMVGLIARLPVGQRIGGQVERVVLSRLPFYMLLRRIAAGLAGAEDENALKPVMVEVNPGIRQAGFIIERNADGKCTVFFPSSPNTGSGSVMLVDGALVTELAEPGHKVLMCLHKWGSGLAALRSKAAGKGGG